MSVPRALHYANLMGRFSFFQLFCMGKIFCDHFCCPPLFFPQLHLDTFYWKKDFIEINQRQKHTTHIQNAAFA